MPVIIATQEAKIRRIKVQSQPEQLVHKILSQKKPIIKIGLMDAGKKEPSYTVGGNVD
jgi:hypothetical protein